MPLPSLSAALAALSLLSFLALPSSSSASGGGGFPPALRRQFLAGAASSPLAEAVPIHLFVDPNSTDANFGETPIRLCALQWGRYQRSRTVAPFFDDLVAVSRCEGGPESEGGGQSFLVTLAELETAQAHRCGRPLENPDSFYAQTSSRYGCVPSGYVYHISRCGSTTVANMLSGPASTLVYSEPQPAHAILRHPRLSRKEKVRWVRVIVGALGRPVAAAEEGVLRPSEPLQPDMAGEGFVWRPRYVYVKTMHPTVRGDGGRRRRAEPDLRALVPHTKNHRRPPSLTLPPPPPSPLPPHRSSGAASCRRLSRRCRGST
jgi:hypothetical protein